MRSLIIAHRGASAYLPEHTLEAKALAAGQGADYLEQDVVASRDGELVVLHDVHLDRVTDVAERFPGRHRGDGRYYVIDFELAELRELRVLERLGEDGRPVFPGRFPPGAGRFHMHTLADELTFIRGLERSAGRAPGVYAEIKRPAWHREQGIDIAPVFLQTLADHGYRQRQDPVFVQCFDDRELGRLRDELGCRMQLVQLVGENAWGEAPCDFSAMLTPAGLDRVAGYADAIGPWIGQLYTRTDRGPVPTGVVAAARKAGLAVHPYTLRADLLPGGFESFEDLVRFLADDLGVEALFTDFPDRTRAVIDSLKKAQ